MASTNMFERLRKALRSSRNHRILGRIEDETRAVLTLREGLAAASDAELKAISIGLAGEGGRLRDSSERVHRALALGCEAASRGLGLEPREEQVAGAILLDAGYVVEMRTGEGKTLSAAIASLPTALQGAGVHVITTNAYLAGRDAEWMKPIYDLLGLSVAVVPSQGTLREKRQAYRADITYASHSDVGFDYLRDHLRMRPLDWVQRGRPFAIIDEVDSILIDEARTPLIIGASGGAPSPLFAELSPIVESLSAELDVTVDDRGRTATLTDHGYESLESPLRGSGLLANGSLFDSENAALNHAVQRCLLARFIYRRDEHYTIDPDGRVVIIDPYTGRMMPSRRWGDGLHQAIEARERVEIRRDQPARASCSYRSLFRLYDRLAGMTGTAVGVAEEFRDVYGLEVVALPTHRPILREDRVDAIFPREEAKLAAVIEEVRRVHERGQPVLVGTASERSAKKVAAALEAEGISPHLLLAKDHAVEASVISNAGRLGAVTVATQLAGRGTDIRLGGDDLEQARRVVDAGGLCVIGYERHRARRVDEQLRGRAGRQGAPGSSQFFVSLEDDLVRRFREGAASELLADGSGRKGWSVEAQRVFDEAQAAAESADETVRVSARQLDVSVDRQRMHFYVVRDALLRGAPEDGDDTPAGDLTAIRARVRLPIERTLALRSFEPEGGDPRSASRRAMPKPLRRDLYELFGFEAKLSEMDLPEAELLERLCAQAATALLNQRRRLRRTVSRVTLDLVDESFSSDPDGYSEAARSSFGALAPMVTFPEIGEGGPADLSKALLEAVMEHLRQRIRREAPRRVLRCFRMVYLRALDEAWADHLAEVVSLRDGIYWLALGRQDPVLVFEREIHERYLEMHRDLERRAVKELLESPPLNAESLRAMEAAFRNDSRGIPSAAPKDTA